MGGNDDGRQCRYQDGNAQVCACLCVAAACAQCMMWWYSLKRPWMPTRLTNRRPRQVKIENRDVDDKCDCSHSNFDTIFFGPQNRYLTPDKENKKKKEMLHSHPCCLVNAASTMNCHVNHIRTLVFVFPFPPLSPEKEGSKCRHSRSNPALWIRYPTTRLNFPTNLCMMFPLPLQGLIDDCLHAEMQYSFASLFASSKTDFKGPTNPWFSFSLIDFLITPCLRQSCRFYRPRHLPTRRSSGNEWAGARHCKTVVAFPA